MSLIAGVDGCPAGWLAVAEDTETEAIRAEIHVTTGDLFRAAAEFEIATIDIPIGLSESEPRECDLIARKLLGPGRASSVFPAPVRATLPAETWDEACELSKKAWHKSLSRQTFAILDRTREVNERMCKDPALQSRIREIHPELCFYFWNAKKPMRESKKTPGGADERLALIRKEFGNAFDVVRSQLPRRAAADDDIMDAFAALWTARRIHSGDAVTIPEKPPRDRCGLKMEMVA